jgi:hypothetical protein
MTSSQLSHVQAIWQDSLQKETRLSLAVVFLFNKVAVRANFTQLDSAPEGWEGAIYSSSAVLDVAMLSSFEKHCVEFTAVATAKLRIFQENRKR